MPLCVLRELSFISAQFFALLWDVEMVHSVHYQTHLLIFDFPLLYYHTSLRWSIMFFLFSGNIHFSFLFLYQTLNLIIHFQMPLNYSIVKFLRDFCNFISNFIINQIPVSFSCFLNCFFVGALSAYVADCLAWIRIF